MLLRLGLALAVLAVAAPAVLAHPADEPPNDDGRRGVVNLTGDGENIVGVKRIQFPGANEVELAGDRAFVSTDKTAETDTNPAIPGGLTIINIADPNDPWVQGTWHSTQAGIARADGARRPQPVR